MSAVAVTALTGALADHRALDHWVTFPVSGKVMVSTGKVELGQGILTALVQIAADELDVALARVSIQSGDTDITPNEGFTAGSQSLQFGGVALRQACAEARVLLMRRAATQLGCDVSELSVRDGSILRGELPSGQDYWTLAGTDGRIGAEVTGAVPRKATADYSIIGSNATRLDLPPKLFGQPVFIHDMVLEGMAHARVIRQPQHGATLGDYDEDAIRRAARGVIEIVRNGNFLAIVGRDETAVDLAAAWASAHVTWHGVDQRNPLQQEASWLLQRPSVDRTVGAPEPQNTMRHSDRHEATYTRGYIAHASVAPSCALAVYNDGHLTVWTHSQGVFPLRAELARSVGLDAAAISVRHVQGPGCYGHNGADDAAADAALIAMQRPGTPIRVRWRREEEFTFEPMGSAMVVKVSATLDDDGDPNDWTAEIWSATHGARPGSANLLAADALPNPPPTRPVVDVPDAAGGGAVRNGIPPYAMPATRIIHHLIPEAPMRTSSLRGLGATANVFAIECFIDEIAERRGHDTVQYRLDRIIDPRGRTVIERVAAMAKWQPKLLSGTGTGRGIGYARYKDRAAYSAVIAEVEVDETIHLLRMWCATDAGLIVNPDGVINQLEGGMLQAASWVLKEQVRVDADGVSSRDWDSYPVLKFSEVPEIEIELVNAVTDQPLGVGEASGGPAAAAIGNAVSHALGVRIRDMPLTRERIMATLLAD